MNFIITVDCNKNCPYCFAAFSRNRTPKDQREMSYGNFLRLLDKLPEDYHIKLLGGEPTLHPDFGKMVDELVRRKKGFTIVSNFLFDDNITDIIIKALGHTKITFLINSTNLDVDNRIDVFAKNYTTIYQYLYKYDQEEIISCGYTLENDKDWKYYVEYTDFLLKHIKKIERLRLSLPFPGDQSKKEDFYFINNKKLGEKFLIMVRKSIDIGAQPSIDCVIYPCMFDNKEELKYIKKFTDKFQTKCSKGSPADIFPDLTLSFCYPLKESIKINTNKHNGLMTAIDELTLRYKILKTRAVLPEACVDCAFRKSEICDGPCLGFFELSGETLGVNI